MKLKLSTKEAWLKIIRGMIISMGAAGVTYLIAVLNFIDVDVYTPAIVGISGIVLNALKVYFQAKLSEEVIEK